jgi:hypothetical protein
MIERRMANNLLNLFMINELIDMKLDIKNKG